MKTTINIISVILIFAIIGWVSSGEVGEQVANPKAPKSKSYYPIEEQVIQKDTSICPDCLESNCIYKEINYTAEDATDTGIYNAIIKVCKKRKLSKRKTDFILKEYYL